MNFFVKLKYKIRNLIGGIFRPRKLNKMRKQLKNKEFSIISANCCGAILTHDLGEQFRSPTVNLWFEAEDFLRFCEDLSSYLKSDPIYLFDKDGYPVVGLRDIKIYAMHYKNFEDFEQAWKRRAQRVNFDNLFIMMTDRDGFDESLLKRLAVLPYHKVVFSSKKYEQYPFVCYVKKLRKDKQVGDMFKYCDIFGNRYYEKSFDCISWLNGETFYE